MNAQRFAYTPHPRFPGGMPCVDLESDGAARREEKDKEVS